MSNRPADHPIRDDIQLLSPEFHQNPFERFAWMRANAPVYWDAEVSTWDGGQGLWGVTRYEDIRAVASDQRLYCSGNSSRPDSPPVPSMINHDEPTHMARRGVIRRRFTPQAVRSYEAFARRCAARLIDAVAERGECDFVREIATPLPMMMIGELLGVPVDDYEKLLHWSDLFATGLQDMPEEHLQQVFDAVRDWNDYITFYFDKRRAEPGDDLISAIVHAKINGLPMSHEELMNEAMLILVGGDETTRHTLSGGMEALLRRPKLFQALRQHNARTGNRVVGNHDLAHSDSNSYASPDIIRHRLVEIFLGLLKGKRRTHRIRGTGKLGDQRVASNFACVAAIGLDSFR